MQELFISLHYNRYVSNTILGLTFMKLNKGLKVYPDYTAKS